MHFSLLSPQEGGTVQCAHRGRYGNKDTNLPDFLTEPQGGLELDMTSGNERKM